MASWRGIVTVALACCLLTGCRSNKVTFHQARHAYAIGDMGSARAMLQEMAEESRTDRVAGELDLAMVELASGEPASAERRLRGLRDHFDALPAGPSLDDAASLATDDNARSFQLPDYEQITLRSMLALCSLAGDGGDAEAYCLQALAKQQELDRQSGSESEEPPRYHQLAFVPYLRGALREATHQDYDTAERSFRLVSAIRPDFAPGPSDIKRAGSGTHSRPGHGVLYVIGFVGEGPVLVETDAPTTTASLQIAAALLKSIRNESDKDDKPVLPTITSVKVPRVHVPPCAIETLGVSAGGQVLGATQTLTDFGELALQRSEAEMPHIIGRAVARRVLKEASVAATSETMGLNGTAAAFLEFAAINAWSATETADTRCWGLLPRELQVLRAELPAGTHEIGFAPVTADGNLFDQETRRAVTIENGRSHYVLVFAPQRVVSVVGGESP